MFTFMLVLQWLLHAAFVAIVVSAELTLNSTKHCHLGLISAAFTSPVHVPPQEESSG